MTWFSSFYVFFGIAKNNNEILFGHIKFMRPYRLGWKAPDGVTFLRIWYCQFPTEFLRLVLLIHKCPA